MFGKRRELMIKKLMAIKYIFRDLKSRRGNFRELGCSYLFAFINRKAWTLDGQ